MDEQGNEGFFKWAKSKTAKVYEIGTWRIFSVALASGEAWVFWNTAGQHLMTPIKDLPIHSAVLVAVEGSAMATALKQANPDRRSGRDHDIFTGLFDRTTYLVATSAQAAAFVAAMIGLSSALPHLQEIPLQIWGLTGFAMTSFAQPDVLARELYKLAWKLFKHMVKQGGTGVYMISEAFKGSASEDGKKTVEEGEGEEDEGEDAVG